MSDYDLPKEDEDTYFDWNDSIYEMANIVKQCEEHFKEKTERHGELFNSTKLLMEAIKEATDLTEEEMQTHIQYMKNAYIEIVYTEELCKLVKYSKYLKSELKNIDKSHYTELNNEKFISEAMEILDVMIGLSDGIAETIVVLPLDYIRDIGSNLGMLLDCVYSYTGEGVGEVVRQILGDVDNSITIISGEISFLSNRIHRLTNMRTKVVDVKIINQELGEYTNTEMFNMLYNTVNKLTDYLIYHRHLLAYACGEIKDNEILRILDDLIDSCACVGNESDAKSIYFGSIELFNILRELTKFVNTRLK